jgi:hypothetical protein
MSQPSQLNFTDVTKFDFRIVKLPNVNFFIDSVTLPDLTLGDTLIQTSFKSLPMQGDTLEYGALTVKYKIDKDYQNYTDIFDWMEALGFPQKREQFSNFLNSQNEEYGNSGLGGLYSDAILTTLSNKNNPILSFHFEGMYPSNLSGISYDTTVGSIEALTAEVTFAFQTMRYERL